MNANVIDPNAYVPEDDLVDAPEYDPLESQDPRIEPDEGQGEGTRAPENPEEDLAEGFLPYVGDPNDDHAPKAVVDDRPAVERTHELFDRMKTRRRVLLAVLRACREPQAPEAVTELVAGMQARAVSVYDGPALCKLLERAGALEQRRSEAPQEGATVVEDGVEYLTAAEPPVVRWVTTEAGAQVLSEDRPTDRFHAKLATEPQYAPVYLAVLEACADGDGRTAKQLGELVDKDPLLQKPRMFAAHFFGVLGECDCLTWDGTWKTTELGLSVMEELGLSC